MSNASSAQSSSTIYQLYGNAGFSWHLAGLFSLKFLVTSFCQLTNADLAYITWKNKSPSPRVPMPMPPFPSSPSRNLRSSCNLLIGICAAATALDMFGTVVPFLLTLTGVNFIPLSLCALIQSPQGMAHVFANNMALFIGLDRLLAVSFPVWYKIRESDNRTYLASVCLLCSTVPLAVLALTYNEAMYSPNNPVLCTLADPLGRWGTPVQVMQLSFEALAALCYVLILLVLHARKANSPNIQIPILKSLALILLLELVGWVAHYSLRLVLLSFSIEPITYWFVINISTYLPYLCWALGPFILYKCAKEYRMAFLAQFRRSNQVAAVTTSHQTATQHAGGGGGTHRSSTAARRST